jgi:OOP family OmpA-OmpF porin
MKTLIAAAACAIALAAFPAAAAGPEPAYEKVALDANVLFGSGSSRLRAEGRDALDLFVRSMYGLEARTVLAIGYADRMGSEAQNQVLSEERVDAVKAYLVSRGLPAERVRTGAHGATQPDTQPGACEGASRANNVACLQPDRRVFIQVSGTRLAR